MTSTPGVAVSSRGESADWSVCLEVDGASGKRVLVERAAGPAATWLRKKAAALVRLSGDARFPSVLSASDRDGWVELVVDDSDVLRTVAEDMERRAVEGRLPGPGELAALAHMVADMLAVLAAEGLVCCGLHPASIGVLADNQWRPWALAPSGAASSASTADLAALLLHVATATPPGALPRLARVGAGLTALNPHLSGALAEVLVDGLRAPANQGEQTPAERAGAFAARVAAVRRVSEEGAHVAARDPWDVRTLLPPLAGRVARSLGSDWEGRRRGLYDGPEGELLALAVAAPVVGTDYDTLADAAVRLASLPPAGESAGLHWGAAGAALALLQVGRLLNQAELVTNAEALSASLVARPFNGPDLMKGAAGRLFVHLAVWRATAEERQLKAAQAAGAWLIERSQPVEVGRCWRSARDHLYVGWAHGAAGVGAALGALALATGDDRWSTAAGEAWRLVRHQARPVLSGEGLAWPELLGGVASSPRWCHGAGGILRFGLVAEALGLPGASELVTRGATACIHTGTGAGPSRCHGLSGVLEVLADVHATTGGRSELDGAHALARILVTFADQQGSFPPDPPSTPHKGLLLGDAGVLLGLARLCAVSRPDLRVSKLDGDGTMVFW